MKKRFFAALLALCMAFALLPATALAAESGTCGGNLTWTLDDTGTLTISGTGAMENYGNSGISVPPPWNNRDTNPSAILTKKVVVENGVTTIGNNAFLSSETITDVTLPSTLTSIGDHAFANCSVLTSLIIPDGVTTIGDDAFVSCSWLTNMTLPNSVTHIGEQAFMHCTDLSQISIPNSVTTIEERAFLNTGLTSVVVPGSVSHIEVGTFWECSNLHHADIQSGVKTIYGHAFAECGELIYVTIPDSVTFIDQGAFYESNKLEYVNYSGTKAQWQAINIGMENAPLTTATIHCSDGDLNGQEEPEPERTKLPSGTKGVSYYYDLGSGEAYHSVADNDDGSHALPKGLKIGFNEEENRWFFGGTPEESGTFLVDLAGIKDDNVVTNWYFVLEIADSTQEPNRTKLPDGVRYVPYTEWVDSELILDSTNVGSWMVDYELQGTLPSGLVLEPGGIISGVPRAAGTWEFTVLQHLWWEVSATGEKEKERTANLPFSLTIADNTDSAVKQPNDYPIIENVGDQDPNNPDHFYMTEYRDEVFRIDGPYSEFTRLLIDGDELERDVDYTAEEGSTVITIQAQTFQKKGEGTHTIAAEFREGGRPDGTLKRVAQNYTLTLPKPSTGGGGGGHSSRPSRPQQSQTQKPKPQPAQPEPTPEEPKGLPFTDVSPDDWFYEDVVWAYENGVMQGVSETSFAPQQKISEATVVAVLARLAKVDLTQFDGAEEAGIEPGKPFTTAAVWAKRSGLLPEGNVFTGSETATRDQMAVMLVKYLRSMAKDTTPPAEPVPFADAAEMSPEGNNAFQVLYQQGIFKGVGGLRMNASGSTTRAHFVVLVHRIYEAAMSET